MGLEDWTICIGTYGSSDWMYLADERAIPSAEAQGCEVIHRHGSTLAQARNTAVALARTEFVVHLDADDELEPGFIEALDAGRGDVRVPRVSCYRDGQPITRGIFMPYVNRDHRGEHQCTGDCLRYGNWILVGAGVRRSLVQEVGGWREWDCYEDFDLWQRCWLAGAEIVATPDALYRQHLRHGSRNHSLPRERMDEVHEEIERANGVSREPGWEKPAPKDGYRWQPAKRAAAA